MPKFSLMAHQTEGVKFLDSVDGIGALLWEPGVGKTGATLAWIDAQAQRLGEFRVLVIAPLTAADTWVIQAPGFMDSVVKARLLEGRTVDILDKIKRSRDWLRVPAARVAVDHKGAAGNSRARSRNQPGRVTILSMSAGALSSWCRSDAKTGKGARQQTVKVLQAVRKYQPHLVIVDESQIIKSDDSNISRVMYQIGQLVPHRIILTGTVNPHSPLDCYGQWRFLAPWTFSDSYPEPWTKTPLLMTRDQARSVAPWPWKRFEARYGLKGGHGGKVIVDVNEDYIDELHARVAERSMVVRKEDALDLPPTNDVAVHVSLTPAEQRVYDEMRDDLAAMLDSGELIESVNALAKYMKLRQITAGFLRDSDETSPTFGEVFTVGHTKQKAVAEVVNTSLAAENRVVVFAYFTAECAAIADLLRKSGPKNRRVEVITGATKNADRLAIRRRFGDVSGNPEPTVLVAQMRTMSISVNELVTAQHAVYASMSERREDWVQSRGRLDRNGQTLPVTFWNVMCQMAGGGETIDEIMLENHKRRGDLEKALLDHIRATPR